jgi:hypothetical protein
VVPAIFMGVGLGLQAYGMFRANNAQAAAEEANAGFFREQADFAREAGDRQRKIFNHESDYLFGDQMSAFAKAGVDTGSSSYFMSQQVLFRQEESYAIKKEADMNVRLAMLRADQSQQTANSLRNPVNTLLPIMGEGASMAGSLL